MKKKIFNILIALVMVVGFSLIPSAAYGVVAVADSYAGYRLGAATGSTSAWSTTSPTNGKYSALLTKGGTGAADSTYVDFALADSGITVANLSTIDTDPEWSFYYKMASGTGVAGPQLELRFTDPDSDGYVEVTLMALQNSSPDGSWTKKPVLAASERAIFYGDDESGSGVAWNGTSVYGLDDMLTAINATTVVDATDWELTRVRLELWEAAARYCYIDTVTIDGTTYDLEPIVMDAATYHTGGTVTVSVYNGSTSNTLSGYAYSSSTDPLLPTYYDLTETSPDVFTGSFDLVGAHVANKLMVNEGDTIYAKCTANWGAGAQTLDWGPTATIDDTDPVFTSVVADSLFYKNEGTITLTVTLDAAGYTVTADFSEIDSEYSAGDEAVTDDTGGVYTVTYAISEDNDIADDEYTITVTAEDGAGNSVEDDSCTASLDNTEPAVTDEAADPVVVQPDTATDVTFTANVTDEGSGLATVTIDLDSIGGSATQQMYDNASHGDETASDDIYTYTFGDLDIAEDDYDLTITATDDAGNVNDTAVITLRVIDDVTDPVIESTDVEYPVGFESARVGDSVIITAVVTDDIAGVDTVTIDATDLDLGAAVALTLDDTDTYSVTLVVGDVDADTYTLTITATDAATNTDTADVDVVVVNALTAFNIDLFEGWNLISTPLIPDDSDIDVVLADITDNVSSVWYYDPSIADPDERWLSYAPDAPGDLTDIVDGQGYWIEMTADNTLTISGVELPAPPSTPPTYDVLAGWNLIGFKSVVAKTATVYLAGDAFDAFVRMYGYDAVDAIYATVQIGGSLQPGQGYWLAVSADGTIYP
jgi:hypothetical protein